MQAGEAGACRAGGARPGCSGGDCRRLRRRRTVRPVPRKPPLPLSSAMRPSRMCSVLTCQGGPAGGGCGVKRRRELGASALSPARRLQRGAAARPRLRTSWALSRRASSCASITLLMLRSCGGQAGRGGDRVRRRRRRRSTCRRRRRPCRRSHGKHKAVPAATTAAPPAHRELFKQRGDAQGAVRPCRLRPAAAALQAQAAAAPQGAAAAAAQGGGPGRAAGRPAGPGCPSQPEF